MTPRVKSGLIAGIIGLVLNICVAAALGICGPFVALLAGIAAGFFAVQQERVMVKGDGARVGAVSGGIAGALVLIGQMIGGLGILILAQSSGVTPLVGRIPSPTADASEQMLYYISGLGVGMCFGIVGVVAAALGGAAGGYLGAPSQPEPPAAVE